MLRPAEQIKQEITNLQAHILNRSEEFRTDWTCIIYAQEIVPQIARK
jgi:hypothetical protein